MNDFNVTILKDSISEKGNRLITLEATYPRFIHAEILTHKMLTKSSSSSRARPVNKYIEQLEKNPAMPIHWGQNQPGMQADQELSNEQIDKAIVLWLKARDYAVEVAKEMIALGLHKQVANRILEPFAWHTVILTGTEWSNFLALRTHSSAQPEMQKIAKLIQEAMKNSIPYRLKCGEWHLPLILESEIPKGTILSPDELVKWKKISAGRCARASYLTHHGIRDLEADLRLCNNLLEEKHLSPFEHQATPSSDSLFYANLKGWIQYRKEIPNEDDFSKVGISGEQSTN